MGPSSRYSAFLFVVQLSLLFCFYSAAQPSSTICVYAVSPSNNPSALNNGLYDAFNEDVLDFKTHRANQNVYSHCDGRGRPNQTNTTSYVTAEDYLINWRVSQINDPLVFLNDVM